jgi:hypothetical protein
MKPLVSKLGRVAVSVLTVIVGVVLTLALISVVSSTPGHDEIYNRQQMVEDQLRYISCLLLIAPEDRIPEAVAACQIVPDATE